MGSCSSRSTDWDSVTPAVFTDTMDDASDHAFARPHRRRYRNHPHQRHQRDDDEIRRLEEIMALQQSLAAMEDFFQSLLGQANFYMEAYDPQNSAGGARGPPPISKLALEGLPVLDSNNSSSSSSSPALLLCGICGEGGSETVLPCGHTFHRQSCVEQWLVRHCTCPICRYELPTDDESYEPGRLERMASRNIERNEFRVKEIPEEGKCTIEICCSSSNTCRNAHGLEEIVPESRDTEERDQGVSVREEETRAGSTIDCID